LTLGDAYGRFMITFDPASSMISYYLEPYTGPATGLVCLAAPMVLAYFLRTIMANIVDSSWEISSNAIDWSLVNGKKWLIIAWQKSLQLKQAYSEKPTTIPAPTEKPPGPSARLTPMSFQSLLHLLLVAFATCLVWYCAVPVFLPVAVAVLPGDAFTGSERHTGEHRAGL
jgi:hypothetical protein